MTSCLSFRLAQINISTYVISMDTTVANTTGFSFKDANFEKTVSKSIVFGGEITEVPKVCLVDEASHSQLVDDIVVWSTFT